MHGREKFKNMEHFNQERDSKGNAKGKAGSGISNVKDA